MISLAAELRRRIREGPILGSLLLGRDPAFVEVYATSGWDFVVADCEHGLQDGRALLDFQRAAETAGIPLLVRAPAKDVGRLVPILDAGLAGVVLAQAEDGTEVSAAAARISFGPGSRRSLNPFVRIAGYGSVDASALAAGTDRPVVWTMAEGADDRATEDILSASGLDGVLVGPYDLSVSVGHPGDVEHRDVQARIAGIFRAAGARGLTPGVFVRGAAAAAHNLNAGARMVVLGVDLDIMRGHLASLREAVAQRYGGRDEG